MTDAYVHGYTPAEIQRLHDQARTLEPLLHFDTAFPAGARVLEAGCGVGAQTLAIARRCPQAFITSIDISGPSLASAHDLVKRERLDNVEIVQASLMDPPFPSESFDHVFVCFVLEHLDDPRAAVTALLAQLRPGGSLTVIEGDHGSSLFHPDSADARACIQALCELQRKAGGDAQIGRALYPLLRSSRLENITVSPRLVYADATHPELAEGFVIKTFTAMVAGVRERAIATGLLSPEQFDRGIADLRRTAEVDGSFCYTFFKAWGTKFDHLG
jgi:SAM-dependent methyltransferase